MTYLIKVCVSEKIKVLSDVKKFLFVLVLFCFMDSLKSDGDHFENDRDSRKLFGGYRITPAYCKASRASKFNRGNTICMFNHECAQRGGEVVGACMDGFLFGACCQLKSDGQSHFPKGPGVVMTSYLDYPDADPDEDFDESDQLNAWHNSFRPVITPGYRPTDKNQDINRPLEKTTEQYSSSLSSEIISEGVSQITNTLLNSPSEDSNIIYIRPGQTDGMYSHNTITHGLADTILMDQNGGEADNIARPSDFTVHIPPIKTNVISTTTITPSTLSTYKPVKPVFKPKPTSKPDKITYITKVDTKKPPTKPLTTTEKYTLLPTVTKETQKVTELTSLQSPITSIMQMLNESTPALSKVESYTSSTFSNVETKSSPRPATVEPVSYSSSFPSHYLSTGHYVTLKPSHSVTILSNPSSYPTSFSTTNKPTTFNKFSTSSNKRPDDKLTTSIYSSSTQFSSPRPSQSTIEDIDSFNRYPTNPEDFSDSITTFSYVTSSTTSKPVTTRKPPSTSYVFGTQPSIKRPVTSPSSIIPNYEIAPDTFASVTPTVIVLSGFQTTKPESLTENKEPQFVEISQEPFKKPVNHITVNNHVESTNNIYMGKPPSYDRPSSPTIVITPKPSLSTSPLPSNYGTRPASISTTQTILRPSSPFYNTVTEVYVPTTFKPELQTSPDDLINFPPVRNPMLNTTSTGIFNTSISISDNELDILHDMEFTTPSFLQEDENLNDKMNLFVNKIVGSLQGTFQELHDIVILDKKQNTTAKPQSNTKTTTARPTKKPATTRRPATTTKKPPPRATTTRKPQKTTRKPTKPSTAYRRPTTTTTPIPPTTTKKTVTTTKKSKPTKKATTTNAATTVTEFYDEVTTEQTTESTINYNDKNLCGVRPLIKSGRVVGGKNANFGEWPWQVLIRESTWLGLFTKNKCGGVLITNRYVTTAAHCQPGFLASLVAVFGENDISGDYEPKKPQSRNIRRVIIHRQYDPATFANDLALLELESPIKFDAHIVPICMPPDGADFTGRVATVTGWGRLKYEGAVPAVLQEVQVPVMENSVCQEMFQTAGHNKIILNSFLCAGYANGQKDSCEGDSGGPLVLQREDGKWQLVGTVSHGIKCAAPYLPGVYMRTTYFKPWLKSITGVH